jgi:hypothetical protein
MIDEIRSFFDGLRDEPAPPWPEGTPPIHPITGVDLRALAEQHHRLGLQSLDDMEAKIMDLYEAGASVPAAIDLVDGVVAIIRRKNEAPVDRLWQIGRLVGHKGPPIGRG